MKFKLKPKEPSLQQQLRAQSNLLLQAADRIDELEKCIGDMDDIIARLESRLNNSEDFDQHD